MTDEFATLQGRSDSAVIHPLAMISLSAQQIPWTDEQKLIITAPCSAKLLVEAGPGTGKTAVACGRVAHLLSEDVNPSSIMMVSFTRTAVTEMRDRIQRWSGEGLVSSVNISTLDSQAFRLGMGCGSQYEQLMNSFEGNVENALKELRGRNATLMEYLGRFQHIILDEAQDLTAARTELATLLLDSLPASAGVTVFADRAQAIYGFTNDVDDQTDGGKHFLDAYPFADRGYKERKLEKIHRTEDKSLLEFFSSARVAVLGKSSPKERPKAVVEHAKSRGKSCGHEIQEIPAKDGDLLLYRKRVSALQASQFQSGPLRMRLPGYPAPVFAWIGLTFGQWTEHQIAEAQFAEQWRTNCPAELCRGWDAARAWKLLLETARAPRNCVDVRKLRSLVARSRPPVELCHLDYGDAGPIFSTIHASKGREADRVFLMLPWNLEYLEQTINGKNIDPEEEARVYYVGTTRVKKEFFHGDALSVKYASKLETSTGRVVDLPFERQKKPKLQFGLAGDIDDAACISRQSEFCTGKSSAAAHQAALVRLWKKYVSGKDTAWVKAASARVTVAGKEIYRHKLMCDDVLIGWSGTTLESDLWVAANLTKKRTKTKCGMRPPDEIERLRLIGLRTCAIALDAASEGSVHEPFSTSGFYLAPMIVGFPSFIFPFYKNW